VAASPPPLLAQAEQAEREAQEPGSAVPPEAVAQAEKRWRQTQTVRDQRHHGKSQLRLAISEKRHSLFLTESDLTADEAESGTRLARKWRQAAQERADLQRMEAQWVALTGEAVPVASPPEGGSDVPRPRP